MSYIDDLIVFSGQNGFGSFGVDLFKGSKSSVGVGDGPFTSFIPTGGQGDEGTHNDSRYSIAYERPSCQVVVRAEDYNVAEATARQLHFTLNFVDQFVNGTWWRSCSPKQEPYDLGLDAKSRPRFAFNLQIVKRLGTLDPIAQIAQTGWIQ